MNSLEFIDKQIKENKKSIRRFNNLLKKTLDDKTLNEYIEFHQNNINQLKQIKKELKAYDRNQKKLNELKLKFQQAKDYISNLEEVRNTLREDYLRLQNRINFYVKKELEEKNNE